MNDRLSIHIKDAHSDKQVLAEALSVSDSGVFVDTPMVFAVNSNVVCRFTGEHEALSFEGKVRWQHFVDESTSENQGEGRERQDTQPLVTLGGPPKGRMQPKASRSGGMGIGFDHLSEDQKRVLRTFKDRMDRRTTSVRLWFAGVKDPVRAQGILMHNGLLLETQLPFLRIGSSVKFRLGQDRASYEGRLSHVEIDTIGKSAVPLLRVGMELAVDKEKTQRMYFLEEREVSVQEGDDPKLSGGSFLKAVHGEGTEGTVGEQQTIQPPRLSEARIGNMMTYVLIAAMAASTGSLITWAVEETTIRPEPTPSAKSAQALHPEDQTRPGSEKGTVGETETNADKAPVAYEKPRITVQSDRTRVWVPLSGSDEDMREYRLSTPGIALNLPQALSRIPYGNYGIHEGLVRRVWVRPFGAGVQVRVITAWAAVRHQVDFSSDGLNITLTP